MRLRLAAGLLLATSTIAAAQDRSAPAGKPSRAAEKTAAEAQKDAVEAGTAVAPVEEREERSKGAVTVAGRRLPYTATAGTLTLRDTEGKPTASMFYTAYTLDGTQPGTKRPITFFYNGGPGSPTFWLHMG